MHTACIDTHEQAPLASWVLLLSGSDGGVQSSATISYYIATHGQLKSHSSPAGSNFDIVTSTQLQSRLTPRQLFMQCATQESGRTPATIRS